MQKKIGSFFSWKKSNHAFRTPLRTKQTYTPFHKKSSKEPSVFKTGLKAIFSFVSGMRPSPGTGRPHRTNKYRTLFPVGLMVVGLAVVLYVGRGWVSGLAAGMEYFEVQDNVVIEGCHVTTAAEIRELGEIRYHTNLFSINPGKLEAILVRHPWVAEVKVQRNWPNRLLIRVVEHVPEALIVQGDPGKGQLYYMDAKGVAFVPAKSGQDLDFPVITGAGDIQDPGRRKGMIADALHFLKLAKTNNPNLPAQSISEIHLDKT